MATKMIAHFVFFSNFKWFVQCTVHELSESLAITTAQFQIYFFFQKNQN